MFLLKFYVFYLPHPQHPKFVNNNKNIIMKNNIVQSSPQPHPPKQLPNNPPLLLHPQFLLSSIANVPPFTFLYTICYAFLLFCVTISFSKLQFKIY